MSCVKTEACASHTSTLSDSLALPQAYEQNITFPEGVIGFPNAHRYALVIPPQNISIPHFLLLQSHDVPSLCFIVIPFDPSDPALDAQDLQGAFDDLRIHPDDARLFLIATLKRQEHHIQIGVNLRAPIILNMKNMQGWQYIFHHHAYPLRYILEQAPMVV